MKKQSKINFMNWLKFFPINRSLAGPENLKTLNL